MDIEQAMPCEMLAVCLSQSLLLCTCLLQAAGDAVDILAHQAVHPSSPCSTDASFHEPRGGGAQAWNNHPYLDLSKC